MIQLPEAHAEISFVADPQRVLKVFSRKGFTCVFSLSTSPLLIEKAAPQSLIICYCVASACQKAVGPGPEPGLSRGLASEECNKIGNICCLKGTGK